MNTAKRERIGRWNDIATRTIIYRTDQGIEVDELDRFEIIRRRVFYDDIMLVTWHRQAATMHFALLSIIAVALAIITIVLLPDETTAAVIVGAVAAAVVVLDFIVLARGADVITIFGRRSKAAVRTLWRKERARRMYGEICAATASAQRRRAAEIAASEPPEPPVEIELPPTPEEPLEMP